MNYSKFRNKKTVIDGITFASKIEANYYCELKLRKKAKDIIDFELQPEFILQPAFIINNEKIRAIKYKADFLIYHDGYNEVVDVKGFETKEFRLKWKMLQYLHKDVQNITFSIIK